jgi:hypothetical protein
MDDSHAEALTLHDRRPEHVEVRELLDQILERLPTAADERRNALLRAIAGVVRDEPFRLASVYAFAEQGGAAGEPLRRALDGLTPKSCGKLLARWATAPAIVRVAESRGDGVLWRIVGADFASGKSRPLDREKLGNW